jgi:hypothetical protein
MAGMQSGGCSSWFGWSAGKWMVRPESAMISGINRIFDGQLEHVIDRKILLRRTFLDFCRVTPCAFFNLGLSSIS